jgi:hypothetical protein
MENIKDVTNSSKDWKDFWHSSEVHGIWNLYKFEHIWNEMDEIEPLTPKTN